MSHALGQPCRKRCIILVILLSCVWHIEGANVVGRVMKETGVPAASVLLDFLSPKDTMTAPFVSVKSDSLGRFRIDSLFDQEYQIRITAVGYPVQYFSWMGNTRFPQYRVFFGPATIDSLIVKLTATPIDNPPLSLLKVTVLDSLGNPYLTGGSYNLTRESDRAQVAWTSAVPSSNVVYFKQLQPERYAINMLCPPYPGQYHDTTGNTTSPTFFIPIGKSDTQSVTVRLSPWPKGSGFIYGKVLTESGTAAAGTRIDLFVPRDMSVPKKTMSADTYGKFAFEGIMEGEYFLKLSSSVYPAQWFSQTTRLTTLYAQDPVWTSPTRDTLYISLVSSPVDNSPRSMVILRVIDSTGTVVKTPGKVSLQGKDQRVYSEMFYDSMRTEYRSLGLWSGAYYVRLSIPPYPDQYYNPQGNTSYPTYPVEVGPQDTVRLSAHVKYLSTVMPPPPDTSMPPDTSTVPGDSLQYGFVSVLVKDSVSNVRDARVVILDMLRMVVSKGYTDSTGRPLLLRVPASKSHYLAAEGPNYPQQFWSPSGPSTIEPTPVNAFVVAPGDTLRVGFTLAPYPEGGYPTGGDTMRPPVWDTKPVLEGYVKSTTGQPIRGARIAVLSPDFMNYGQFSPRHIWSPYVMYTDSTGHFVFYGVSPGEYFVMAEADSQNYIAQFLGGVDQPAQSQRIRIDTTTQNASFQLRKGAIVTGHVATPDGSPIAQAGINIHEINGSRYYEEKTDAAGTFSIKGVPSSKWNRWAWHEQYTMAHDDPSPGEFSSVEGSTYTLPKITMTPAGRLSGPFAGTALTADSTRPWENIGELLLFSDSIPAKERSLWPKQNTGVRFLTYPTTTSAGTWVSDQVPLGRWRAIFVPRALSDGMRSDTASYAPFVKGTGWSIVGYSQSLLSSPAITTTAFDTVRGLTISIRSGYSVFGVLKTVDGSALPSTNWGVNAFVKQDSLMVCVAQSRRTPDGRSFELPGLVAGEEYFLNAWADGYPGQFWSPGGTNTTYPGEPYTFDPATSKQLEVVLSRNPAGGGYQPQGPVSLWAEPDSLGILLKWGVESNLAVDSVFLFARDFEGQTSRLFAGPRSSSGMQEFRDTRGIKGQQQYVVLAKGSTVAVKSNRSYFDPRQNQPLSSGALWIDVSPSRWGVQIEWGAGNFQATEADSISLYRMYGTDWRLMYRQSAYSSWLSDHNWSSSDSGKTLFYKVELSRNGSVTHRSPSASILLGPAFFANLSNSLSVGPYERYKTIQQAIDAAANFDHINVRSGTYNERLNLRGKVLSIDGDWEFGKPPVIDAAGDTAIAIPQTAGSQDWDRCRIGGFKIRNASVGIRASASLQIDQCLFDNVRTAVLAKIDSAKTVEQINADPFASSTVEIQSWQCTFIAHQRGDLAFWMQARGIAEAPGYSGPYTGTGEFYVYPVASLSSRAGAENSIFAYYYSRGGISDLPVRLDGQSPGVRFSNCDLWQTSSTPGSMRIMVENQIPATDPRFVDTSEYFLPDSTPLRFMASNRQSIGYDARRMYYGKEGGSDGPDRGPSVVKSLTARIAGLGMVGLTWSKPDSGTPARYQVYRVPGDTSLFYINQESQWDVKIPRDSMFTVIDSFSTTSTSFVDSTAQPGKPYVYVVAAVDSSGNQGEIRIPAPPPISSYIVNSYNHDVRLAAERWYMISPWGGLPVTLPTAGDQVVYRWDDTRELDKLMSRYAPATELRPGEAYWIKLSRDTVFRVTDLSLSELVKQKDTLKIRLRYGQSGWNQVASMLPYPVAPSWLGTFTAWEWNPDSLGYRQATVLQPWRGYWIHTTKDTVLALDHRVTTGSALARARRIEGMAWELRLALHGPSAWDPDNYVGVVAGAAKQATLEQPEPPAAFGSPQLFFVRSNDPDAAGVANRLAHSYVPLAQAALRHEWLVGISPSRTDLSMRIDGLKSLPGDVYVFWVDSRGSIDLRQQGEVPIAAHDADRYGYLLVTRDYRDVLLYSNRFDLRPGFPNPFRGATSIEFAIPYAWGENGVKLEGETRKVKMVVYDIAGRQVTTLVDGRKKVGFHRVVWRGDDCQGRPVPAGFYLVKLTSGTDRKTVKLVRIR